MTENYREGEEDVASSFITKTCTQRRYYYAEGGDGVACFPVKTNIYFRRVFA